MGLDGVELVMAFEERFGIEIKDEEAAQLLTPANVIDFITAKLHAEKDKICASQRTFYCLRRAAIELFKVSRSQIRPDTSLCDFFPTETRVHRWAQLGAGLDVISWPRLEHPLGLGGGIIFGSLILSGIVVWSIPAVHVTWLALTVGGLLWTGLVAAGFHAAQPLRKHFPSRLNNFGDLSRRILLRSSSVGEQENTREQIRIAVREIICEQIGVANDFDDNDSFVDDLGLD